MQKRFKTHPNTYDGAFFAKTVKSHKLFLQKLSSADVWLASKYASGIDVSNAQNLVEYYKKSYKNAALICYAPIVNPWWNPPWRGEGAYLTKRFHPVHQQGELVGVMLLRSSRTNRSC